MTSSGSIWAPMATRVLKHSFTKTLHLIKARIAGVSRTITHEYQPIFVQSTSRQSIHPIARLRQAKERWYTTHRTINATVRRYMSIGSEHAAIYNRSSFPKSAISTTISRLTTRAPFASTLRPNLTVGAFSRTAGGYSTGGGRAGGTRYFSHIPEPSAQVVNNVSAAVRAFWISGQKAQFDGMTPLGEKRYRNITNLQEGTRRNMGNIPKSAPGSFIDFSVNPTFNALTPLTAAFPFSKSSDQFAPNLNTEGFLEAISIDFSCVMKNLAAILNDLKRLASLGDLPITLEQKSVLRVRFPGCDAETIERLCNELGVQRGIINQDEDFDSSTETRMDLIFPYAPTLDHLWSLSDGSLRSQTGRGDGDMSRDIVKNPWLEGYESMHESSEGEFAYFAKPSYCQSPEDYEDVKGIYKFLEQCDNARGSDV